MATMRSRDRTDVQEWGAELRVSLVARWSRFSFSTLYLVEYFVIIITFMNQETDQMWKGLLYELLRSTSPHERNKRLCRRNPRVESAKTITGFSLRGRKGSGGFSLVGLSVDCLRLNRR